MRNWWRLWVRCNTWENQKVSDIRGFFLTTYIHSDIWMKQNLILSCVTCPCVDSHFSQIRPFILARISLKTRAYEIIQRNKKVLMGVSFRFRFCLGFLFLKILMKRLWVRGAYIDHSVSHFIKYCNYFSKACRTIPNWTFFSATIILRYLSAWNYNYCFHYHRNVAIKSLSKNCPHSSFEKSITETRNLNSSMKSWFDVKRFSLLACIPLRDIWVAVSDTIFLYLFLMREN